MKKWTLEKYNYRKLGWLHDSLKFIGLFAALFVLFRFVIGFSVVDGESMYPTLRDGEFIVYNRMATDYEIGDIVCLWVPSGHYYIKRVAAVAGDEVDINGGLVYINGQEIYETYVSGKTAPEQGAVIYPYTVGKNDVFVMGDNREVSIDSRSFGEVNKLQIRGKVVFHFGF